MAKYYCSCKGDLYHKKIHETEVDSEERCTNCGYYAFARPETEHKLFPRLGLCNGKDSLEVSKDIAAWKSNELYYQYWHRHGSPQHGLYRLAHPKKKRSKNEQGQNRRVSEKRR